MPLPPPAEIARLEESRLATAVAALAPVAAPIAGGIMSRARPGSWMNKAIGLGMDAPVTTHDIQTLQSFYTRAGIEPRLELCPYSHDSLLRAAADAGFVIRRFTHVLVRPTAGPPTPSAPPGLVFHAIHPDDAPSLRTYALTAHRGFVNADAQPTEEQLAVWISAARHPATTAILATLDGQPAAAGCLEVHPPYATLFALSVLPAFRHRGIQSAAIAERLRLAAGLGAAYATLSSEPEGPTERNARRLGFTPAYTRVTLIQPGPGLIPVG